MCKIDRNKIKEAFAEYTDKYNRQDAKVSLKISHTYRVATLCEEIAKSQKRNERETDFAWLSGMLHDVGRFEQLRNYGTFIDAKSVDHIVGHMALVFGLVFLESLEIVKRQGYLEKMLSFSSENKMTQEQFGQLREVLRAHVAQL